MHIWKNTKYTWGLVPICLHWLTAIAVFGLYGLGWYMVDLDYYDAWYRSAPFWHKSVGLTLVVVVAIRLVVRGMTGVPGSLVSHAKWERVLAGFVHLLLYLLLVATFISGYLISTADGRGISFYGWFDVPAVVKGVDNLEDLAGSVHVVVTDVLILLAVLHALGALKHHAVDRDETLKRMLGKH